MARDIHGRRRIGARAAGSRTGAVAAGIGVRRRRGLGWLWLLLLLAVLAAIIVWLALRHRGDAAASSSPTPAAVVATASTTAGSTTAGPSSTTQPTPSATASGPAMSPTSAASDSPGTGEPATPATPAGLGSGLAAIGGGAVTAHQIPDATAGEVGTVLFADRSASVDAQGRSALGAVAAQLRASKAGTVTVTGFSNDLTNPTGNTALAGARASAVATVLENDLAGTPTMVRTLAAGQTDPAAAETTAAGRLADARATVTTSGTALIGGDEVDVHPAAGSAALPATTPAAAADAVGVALFPDSSAALDAFDRAVIAAAAARISAAHDPSVVVTGYTDSVGGTAGALALSRARAKAVADALRTDLGAAAPTITINAVGEQQQIASDQTADGRRLNRRAVITTG